MKTDEETSPAKTLIRWANLSVGRSSPQRSWAPVQAMLEAAIAESKKVESVLGALLADSDKRLAPLGDPLRADVGLNRWLRDEREEAYSDWFGWILEQLQPSDVVQLLQIQNGDEEMAKFCRESARVCIEREVVIRQGRLDLVVGFDENAVLVIEVKTTSADEAHTAKQEGYFQWLEKELARYKHPILLAVDADRDDYEGFVPLRWADVCIELRRMIPSLLSRIGTVKAAMIIAFVSAVEMNLLHLATPEGTEPGRRLFYSRTADHLQNSLL